MRLQHLRTNRQFMIGNTLVFVGVLFVVVLFIYMSLRLQAQKSDTHYYNEMYRIKLTEGFSDAEYTIYMNDSIIFDGKVTPDSRQLEVMRFAEETSLLIVNKATEQVAIFELPTDGGNFSFRNGDNGISLIE